MQKHVGGNRMMVDINREHCLPAVAAKALLKDVKDRCPLCKAKARAPKTLPHTPILSTTFGERVSES